MFLKIINHDIMPICEKTKNYPFLRGILNCRNEDDIELDSIYFEKLIIHLKSGKTIEIKHDNVIKITYKGQTVRKGIIDLNDYVLVICVENEECVNEFLSIPLDNIEYLNQICYG